MPLSPEMLGNVNRRLLFPTLRGMCVSQSHSCLCHVFELSSLFITLHLSIKLLLTYILLYLISFFECLEKWTCIGQLLRQRDIPKCKFTRKM